jgi:hypothetical protein
MLAGSLSVWMEWLSLAYLITYAIRRIDAKTRAWFDEHLGLIPDNSAAPGRPPVRTAANIAHVTTLALACNTMDALGTSNPSRLAD